MQLHEVADGVREMARAREPDRYLAALLAARPVRGDLVVLAAFAAEVGRIAGDVSEAPLGEIRLQWWRDAIVAMDAGDATGHPVGDALARVVRAHALDTRPLQALIDARSHDLYSDPFDDEAALESYLLATHGGLFAHAATVAISAVPGSFPQAALDTAAAAAGRAYGIARLLVDLPHVLRRGRVPLPLSLLLAHGFVPGELGSPASRVALGALVAALSAQARAALGELGRCDLWQDRRTRAALVPAAMVEPYLQSFERTGSIALEAALGLWSQPPGQREPGLPGPTPLRRVWRLWWANRGGAV